MNPVSLAMDGLLAVLLLTAVGVGVRLNGKLRLLRDGQGQFVKAVGDLDVAAARAQAGLAELRAATTEAHDALLSRIETARGLLPRLERASEDAGGAASRLEEGVRAADAARRAQAAAEAAQSQAPRAAAPRPSGPEVPTVARAVAAEPIPFPGPRREAPIRGLVAALEAAERIVEAEAEVEQAPARTPLPIPAAAQPSAAADGDRLARFVARRRGARA